MFFFLTTKKPFKEKCRDKYNLKGKKFNSKTLKNYDLVLLATDHDEFDFDLIRKEAKIVVDTRGKIKSSKNVFRA